MPCGRMPFIVKKPCQVHVLYMCIWLVQLYPKCLTLSAHEAQALGIDPSRNQSLHATCTLTLAWRQCSNPLNVLLQVCPCLFQKRLLYPVILIIDPEDQRSRSFLNAKLQNCLQYLNFDTSPSFTKWWLVNIIYIHSKLQYRGVERDRITKQIQGQ